MVQLEDTHSKTLRRLPPIPKLTLCASLSSLKAATSAKTSTGGDDSTLLKKVVILIFRIQKLDAIKCPNHARLLPWPNSITNLRMVTIRTSDVRTRRFAEADPQKFLGSTDIRNQQPAGLLHTNKRHYGSVRFMPLCSVYQLMTTTLNLQFLSCKICRRKIFNCINTTTRYDRPLILLGGSLVYTSDAWNNSWEDQEEYCIRWACIGDTRCGFGLTADPRLHYRYIVCVSLCVC